MKRLKTMTCLISLSTLVLAVSPALAQSSGNTLNTPDPIETVIIIVGVLAVAAIGVAYAVQSLRNGSDHK